MQFFVLSLATATSTYAEMELIGKPERAEPPTCNVCGARLCNLLRLPPHRYRLKHGTPGDLLTDGLFAAMSLNFVESYRQSNLKGLEFSESPLEIVNSDLTFFMASPCCTYTHLDETASGVVINSFRGCDKCRAMSMKRIERLVINEATWTGEDVFMTGNLFGSILASQRFVDFVETNNFSNFQFIAQKDYHFDFGDF
jgi:hypothetical protein